MRKNHVLVKDWIKRQKQSSAKTQDVLPLCFEYALCTFLMASGADAYITHVTTTPSVAYITKVDEETILKVEDYIDGIKRFRTYS